MTFEEALKRLAEQEPGKFGIELEEDGTEPHAFEYHKAHGDCHRTYPPFLSQDNIDEILAEIGWEYEIKRGFGERGWTTTIFKVANKKDAYWVTNTDTKLNAAKAALIAVVEREYPL